MPDLGDVLAAVLSGMAHARRQADETAAELAEYYRTDPLLAGMAAPRFRVPELTLELPLLLDDFEEQEEAKPATKAAVISAVAAAVRDAADRQRVALPRAAMARVRDRFSSQLDDAVRRSPEKVAQAAESALRAGVGEEEFAAIDPARRRRMIAEVTESARNSALSRPTVPPRLRATVVTEQVRQVDPDRVVHIRLTIAEEGVEWTPVERPDGTVTHTLTPE